MTPHPLPPQAYHLDKTSNCASAAFAYGLMCKMCCGFIHKSIETMTKDIQRLDMKRVPS